MGAKFVGGPLDGLTFTPEQVTRVGTTHPMQTESGMRTFVLMPSPTNCTRILRGDPTEGDSTLWPYEILRLASGVEFHAAEGAYQNVLAEMRAPLLEEQLELKKKFGGIADKLIQQVKSVAFTATTEVRLVRHMVDRSGIVYATTPITISGTPTLTGFDAETARKWAQEWNQQTALDNIESLVRGAPTDFIHIPEHPSNMLQFFNFELQMSEK